MTTQPGASCPALDCRLKTPLAVKKNETGCRDGDLKATRLCDTDRVSPSRVRDVSTDRKIRTQIVDLDKAFDRNCILNSCDDSGRGQCMVEFEETSDTGKKFGFMPSGTLRLYNGDPVYYETIPDIISTHFMIKNSGVPNFLQCRIPVTSNLNIHKWRFHLTDYWDKQLPDLLEYGFPIDFDRDSPLVSTLVNHASATQNVEHVAKYLEEELQHEAIIGPFNSPPIPIHISPLMTRDKQDSMKKRTIMDLSWPRGLSVNQGVNKDKYLNTPYVLNYPSVDDITASLCRLGPAAQLFKIDISRAFRQIKIDPGDIDLLDLQFNSQYFIDLSVPFGYRHGSKIFQRCTDSIHHIMAKHGFTGLYNYIDDLIFTGLPSKINLAYEFLQNLLQDLGLDISSKKLVPPSTSVVCLGILINTIDRTISIPPSKLQDIANMCKNWTTKTYCSKNQLQSLLGSLLYITKCVKPARIFLNRILHLLRQNFDNTKIILNAEFFKDLAWFNEFLSQYNGVTFYDHKFSKIPIHLDACLTGLGGHFGSMVYSLSIPLGFRDYTIVHLELLNIVVAAKIWAQHWSNQKIQIFCDNMAVVEVLTTGKTRDVTLATCARSLWLIAALYNIDFIFSHIPGVENTVADLLSRWNNDSYQIQKLHKLVHHPIWIDTHIDLTLLNHVI